MCPDFSPNICLAIAIATLRPATDRFARTLARQTDNQRYHAGAMRSASRSRFCFVPRIIQHRSTPVARRPPSRRCVQMYIFARTRENCPEKFAPMYSLAAGTVSKQHGGRTGPVEVYFILLSSSSVGGSSLHSRTVSPVLSSLVKRRGLNVPNFR